MAHQLRQLDEFEAAIATKPRPVRFVFAFMFGVGLMVGYAEYLRRLMERGLL